jgi:hypothetical protein
MSNRCDETRRIFHVLLIGKMRMRRSLLLLLLSLLLFSPAYAQNRSGGAHPQGGGARIQAGGAHAQGGGARPAAGGRVSAPPIYHGGPRGPVPWESFHHDTSPTRVAPHRFGASNLPRPNNWHGGMSDFNLSIWQGGMWRNELHNGRAGWWWVIGPDWFAFDEPVYPYPDLYTPFGEPIGWWYWCDASQEYYPYVTFCAVPWESVMPRM